MDRIILDVNARIILKQYVISDSETIFKLIDGNRNHLNQRGDTTAQKYPTIKSVRDSILYPKNPERLRFGIWDKNVLIGTIDMTPDEDTEENLVAEIGHFLGECYQGKGYMTRSLARLVQYAFSGMGIQMVYALVTQGNEHGANVLMKAGFRKGNMQDNQQGFYLERN